MGAGVWVPKAPYRTYGSLGKYLGEDSGAPLGPPFPKDSIIHNGSCFFWASRKPDTGKAT